MVESLAPSLDAFGNPYPLVLFSCNKANEVERQKVHVVEHGFHGLQLHEKNFMQNYDKRGNACGEVNPKFSIDTSIEPYVNMKEKNQKIMFPHFTMHKLDFILDHFPL